MDEFKIVKDKTWFKSYWQKEKSTKCLGINIYQ
jgi:hypothetical protein